VRSGLLPGTQDVAKSTWCPKLNLSHPKLATLMLLLPFVLSIVQSIPSVPAVTVSHALNIPSSPWSHSYSIPAMLHFVVPVVPLVISTSIFHQQAASRFIDCLSSLLFFLWNSNLTYMRLSHRHVSSTSLHVIPARSRILSSGPNSGSVLRHIIYSSTSAFSLLAAKL
jgi:hypothetical protein